MNRWNGKHPMPYDFFFTFNEASGQDLNWLYKPWFFEFGYPDLGIEKVSQEKKSLNITIQKIGKLPVPIYIEVFYHDESKEIINETADVKAIAAK